MQFNTDPANKWVAVYRIIVILLLIAQTILVTKNHQTLQTEVKGVQSSVDGLTR